MLTQAASRLLENTSVVYTSAPDHPALAHLAPEKIRPLSPNVMAQPASILTLTDKPDTTIVCALPGHPLDTPLVTALHHMSYTDESFTLRIIPGISILDSFGAAPGVAAYGYNMHCIEASHLAYPTLPEATDEPAWCEIQSIEHPYTPPLTPYPLNPIQPTLIWCSQQIGLDSRYEFTTIRDILLVRYPANHPIQVIQLDHYGRVHQSSTFPLEQLPSGSLNSTTALAVPAVHPAANRQACDGLEWVVMRLLGPAGCPWDRKQTFQSLRGGLLEEVYEVLEALDANDMTLLSEELGDLLLQVFIHSEMARQAHHFTLEQVLEHICSKLIRRHPHVFADLVVRGTGEVLHNWEHIKAQELAAKGRQRSSVLDGVPPAMPALAATQKYVSKAVRSGFSWDTLPQVWEKLHEELEELTLASESDTHEVSDTRQQHLTEEIGDVLFVVTILAHWFRVDAESALREANAKFRSRFTTMEQILQERGLDMHALSLNEKLDLWHEARAACGE